ncbi:exonuclease SbcCD subunit D [Motilibacter aurantiacus]|uniref:exonuclease SbcCD subunit D n=1 Tax=Motilibacter aurantiacus TaxID=2714955 RepID=UPI001408F3DD|nr:exonuclease SbcCD subunit D [Motilibacter aurantiacus]
MRVLHTSDWHLGRSFHREGMLGPQAAFVDFLVDLVRAEGVDVVLVAGDVYDRALPSVDAVQLFDDALARLAATGARVLLLSGNHDSASRLGFGSRLLDLAGVHLRTDPGRLGEPVVLDDAHGPVAFYPLPYLEPDAVAGRLGCPTRSHASVLGEAMRRVRADLAGRPGARSVVAAHAFVAGGLPSDSERDITVGGVSVVPVETFAGVDYAALGHLHGAQAVSPWARYSGSPLAYSFSEAAHSKSVALVDLGPDGLSGVELVPCPVPRPLARLRGTLDALLADPALARHEQSWLQVTLTDPARPREPMERLRARFPHVLVLGHEPELTVRAAVASYSERVRGLDDLALLHGFVEHVRGGAASAPEAALLQQALEAARRAEAEA